jgi:hypothetical protein
VSNRADFVMSAFFRLTDHEKERVAKQIQEYLCTGIPLRPMMEEKITVVLHPPPLGCPICGR